MVSRNEVLAEVVKNDVEALKKWTMLPQSAQLRKRVGFDPFGGGLHYQSPDPWFRGRHAIGGPEKIAVMIQRIDIDTNADGSITEAEYQQNEKSQLKVVDACLAQLLNTGIVAGLTLTVFYPMAMSKLEPSEDSLAYFGHTVTDVFTYAYYIFMYYCVVESVILVYKSARAYLHLSMWMSCLDMKLWYLDRINMGAYVASSFNIIKSVVWSVPMGVAVTVSPLAGALALVAFGYFYASCLLFSKTDVETLWFMRQYTSHKLQARRPPGDESVAAPPVPEKGCGNCCVQ
jgi:hypothetical protein